MRYRAESSVKTAKGLSPSTVKKAKAPCISGAVEQSLSEPVEMGEAGCGSLLAARKHIYTLHSSLRYL